MKDCTLTPACFIHIIFTHLYAALPAAHLVELHFLFQLFIQPMYRVIFTFPIIRFLGSLTHRMNPIAIDLSFFFTQATAKLLHPSLLINLTNLCFFTILIFSMSPTSVNHREIYQLRFLLVLILVLMLIIVKLWLLIEKAPFLFEDSFMELDFSTDLHQ